MNIVILGIDGSGKTTVVDSLKHHFGMKVVHFHFMPIPYKRRMVNDDFRNVKKANLIKSTLKVFYWIIKFHILYLRNVDRFNLNIFDRIIYDAVCHNDRYGIKKVYASRLLLAASVFMDYTFYIDVSPDIIMARSSENSIKDVQELRRSYKKYADKHHWIVIDGNKSKEEVFKDILCYIEI